MSKVKASEEVGVDSSSNNRIAQNQSLYAAAQPWSQHLLEGVTKIRDAISSSKQMHTEEPFLNLLDIIRQLEQQISAESDIDTPNQPVLVVLDEIVSCSRLLLDRQPAAKRATQSERQAGSHLPELSDILSMLMAKLGDLYLVRFTRLRCLGDVNMALEYSIKALPLMDESHAYLPCLLKNIGTSYRFRFMTLSHTGDIDQAIHYHDWAVTTATKEIGTLLGCLIELGNSYEFRFKFTGHLGDLNRAIQYLSQAVTAASGNHTYPPITLNTLGVLHLKRYEQLNQLDDVDTAIKWLSRLVALFDESCSHSDWPVATWFTNLGDSYHRRFHHLEHLDDLDKSIVHLTHAISLISEGHEQFLVSLDELRDAYQCRFAATNFTQRNDLDQAIQHAARLVKLTAEGNPEFVTRRVNLGQLHRYRFGLFGQLDDIENAIQHLDQALSHTPEGHGSFIAWTEDLGNAYRRRFERLKGPDDIDKAIEYLTHAVALTPADDVHLSTRLSGLCRVYHQRFHFSAQPDDIDMVIKHKSQVITLMPQNHEGLPVELASLGEVYFCRYTHYKSLDDAEKAIQYLTPEVDITPELHARMPWWLSHLGLAHLYWAERTGDLDNLHKAIEYLTQVVGFSQDDHPEFPDWLGNLASSHLQQFQRLGKLEDIDRAIQFELKAMTFRSEVHPRFPQHLTNLGTAYERRFKLLNQLDDINKSIEYLNLSVTHSTQNPEVRAAALFQLGDSYHRRFEYRGQIDDINTAIQYQIQALELTPYSDENRPERLGQLGNSYDCRFNHLEQVDDLDKAIDNKLQAVMLTQDGDVLLPNLLATLGESYHTRFHHSENMNDADQAIQYLNRAVALTPDNHPRLPDILYYIACPHRMRWERLNDSSSLASSLGALRKASKCSQGRPLVRFKAACRWAELVSSQDREDELQAYQIAMELLPQVVWLGTSIDQRYLDIDRIGNIAVRAAAAAINAERCMLALEWLEQGRSIVWNQTLQLRTPMDNLAAAHPALADELGKVTRDLHSTSTQGTHMISLLDKKSSLEQTMQEHHRLAEQFEVIVSRVRQLAGFEDFLRHKRASELLRAAQNGFIVMINVHTSRCDALVLSPTEAEILHIPLTRTSSIKIAELHDQIERSLSQSNLRERHVVVPERTAADEFEFESVLASLWLDIVKPVLEALGLASIQEGNDWPHVTWCTTGSLSFLPLHAAGYFDRPQKAVFDYVVSSYTPTLTALLSTSTESLPQHSSIVAIGQEATPGQSPLPGTATELAYIANHATTAFFHKSITNEDATSVTVLDAMTRHDWVHLACHAHQNTLDPTHSGFFLHDGILSLATITRKAFKNKGLAFLSACQTATGDKKLVDEAVHLASGMLMAGYPSVIATMWSIVDADAPLIADKVYGTLLSNGQMNIRQTANALHAAVRELRIITGARSFARWIPYVHIGN
ncbi:unnamed protein product [Rhizoctonia solani]|uniref:CHAT domain-containing protein n=1 Tax=Rhizoctonia solani TaxID=456999 RepID=A0A8H2XHW2_9AGAM|nr:unnamed protein product [Rhizoctonia solani]